MLFNKPFDETPPACWCFGYEIRSGMTQPEADTLSAEATDAVKQAAVAITISNFMKFPLLEQEHKFLQFRVDPRDALPE